MSFPEIEQWIDSNRKWASNQDPSFLAETAKGQAPKVLWLGCADSRVPESVILARKPGDIFVHRNVGNQFQPNDDSANAIMEYGLLTVGCEHVIVVGHTGCGACMVAHASAPSVGVGPSSTHLERFIDPVVRLRDSLGPHASIDELIRANIEMSVRNVLASDAIKKARAQGIKIHVHGWLYELAKGHVHDLGLTESN